MVNIFNKTYYIDLDMLIKTCKVISEINEDEESEDEPTLEINVFKYEVLKMCIDRVLSEYIGDEDEDSSPLFKKDSTSLKIAMATLIKNNILIEFDEEYE